MCLATRDEKHLLANFALCDEQLTAGQAIPTTGFWSTTGATSGSDASCQSVPSGQLFYAYNYPEESSGNTGYSMRDTIQMYMVMDASGAVYLVIGLDAPQNTGNTGQKRISASFTSTGLTGLLTPPTVVLSMAVRSGCASAVLSSTRLAEWPWYSSAMALGSSHRNRT